MYAQTVNLLRLVIPNPAMEPLGVLVGTWNATATHPMFPNTTFHGRTSFQWLEEGAFLIMHAEYDEADIPNGIAIFGSDDSLGTFFMLYFDVRGVSRKYDVSIDGSTFTWSRIAPKFSQRFTWTVADDTRTMIGRGQLSRDDIGWEKDLEVTYTRAQ